MRPLERELCNTSGKMCNGALDARATDIAGVLNTARVPGIARVFDTVCSLDTAGVCDGSLTFILFALCGLMPVV